MKRCNIQDVLNIEKGLRDFTERLAIILKTDKTLKAEDSLIMQAISNGLLQQAEELKEFTETTKIYI